MDQKLNQLIGIMNTMITILLQLLTPKVNPTKEIRKPKPNKQRVVQIVCLLMNMETNMMMIMMMNMEIKQIIMQLLILFNINPIDRWQSNLKPRIREGETNLLEIIHLAQNGKILMGFGIEL